MNGKQKIIIGMILFFVAAGLLIGYGFYAETTKIVDFNEFTVETPQMCEFEDISSRYNSTFIKSYRCTSMDLTITTFDKEYIESTYQLNTGNPIDFVRKRYTIHCQHQSQRPNRHGCCRNIQ